MKRWGKRIAAVSLLLILILVMAWNNIEHTAYHTILRTLLSHSVTEVNLEALDALNQPVLLDARESKEYAVSHIAGSRWVGYRDFDLERVKDLPKETPVVVYCSIGYRSEKVAEQLVDAGFTNVHNFVGGLFEWKNADRPLVDANGPTQRVHAYDRLWGIWLHSEMKVYD